VFQIFKWKMQAHFGILLFKTLSIVKRKHDLHKVWSPKPYSKYLKHHKDFNFQNKNPFMFQLSNYKCWDSLSCILPHSHLWECAWVLKHSHDHFLIHFSLGHKPKVRVKTTITTTKGVLVHQVISLDFEWILWS
jgi:hypothetical protein